MSQKPVLVVDDDPGQLELIAGLLDERGYRVLTATDGRQALALLREERPALILLDLIMPVMTGYEFLRHLWSISELEDIPVVVVTGAHVPNPGGVVGFLRKPLQSTDLLLMVERQLPRPSRADAQLASGG